MSAIGLAVLAFLCAATGAVIGLVVRGRLPAHHLSKDSTDVIKLSTGFMATLVALVLSLLVSSANGFRQEVEREYRQGMVALGQLDQRLRAYGPETAPIRELLRETLAAAARQRWAGEDFTGVPAGVADVRAALIDIERRIVRLRPTDDEQKLFQSQSLQLAAVLVQINRLMSDQAGINPLPIPILVALMLCSGAIFLSFGLYVQPNHTVIGALSVSALAVAGAVFLIVELNTPFSGLLQLPSAPARAALVTLGK
jgi:hypothetical protein